MKPLPTVLTRLFVLVILVLAAGCQSPITKPQEATPAAFLYRTIGTVAVEIRVPYEGAEVGLYHQGTLVLQARAVGSTTIAVNIDLPLVAQQVELRSSSMGLPSTVTVPVVDGHLRYDYSQPAPASGSQGRSVAGGEGHNTSAVGYQTLGGWTNAGTPDYLEAAPDTIEPGLYPALNALLPKGRSVMKRHPELLAAGRPHLIRLTQATELTVSFLHESAGYNNTVGYYTYPEASGAPTLLAAQDITILFPSMRYAAHGGGLNPGMQVKIGPFPAGTVVGLVLVSNGYNEGQATLSRGFHWFTTDDGLNPDETGYQRHVIFTRLADHGVVAFHDQMRDHAASQDFNAAILGVRSAVPGAIDWTGVTDLGLPETFLVADDSPDPDSPASFEPDLGAAPPLDGWASRVSLPGENLWNTIAFEDCWPAKDDYDFNDLVVEYHFTEYLNGEGRVLRLVGQFRVVGVLASFDNGLAFELGVRPTAVQAVYGGQRTAGNPNWRYASNGVELAQDWAVINVMDSSKSLYHPVNPPVVTVTVDFATPVLTSALGSAPFNMFLLVDGERGREVHLPGLRPTRQAYLGYFGTRDDQTQLGTEFTYQTADDLPWALVLPGVMQYPKDRHRVGNLYLQFDSWVSTQGASFPDWYLDLEGYRDKTQAYN